MMRVYFDYNATTPVAPEVLAAMLPYFSEEYGNASSIHTFGQRGRGAVEQARESVAALLGARPAEIMFSSGGTESNNHAIFGVVGSGGPASAKHVITSAIEHSAVLDPCEALAKRGVAVTVLPVDRDGLVNPEDVRRAIRPETVLITIMLANNELGTLEPIEEIGKIAAETGVTLHTDAVQAAGKVPIDVTELGVHLLSISAHKFYGPKGVGALYVRKGTRLEPLMYGGHSERDRRPGTEDVAAIAGLGKAADLAMMRMEEEASACRGTAGPSWRRGCLSAFRYARVNGSRAQRTAQYHEFDVSVCRGRVHGDRAGLEGHRLLYRRGVLVGSGRAVSRADGDRPGAGRCARDIAPQPGASDNRMRKSITRSIRFPR